jgi:DNA-binding NarL/FixJ family response regulator
VIKVAVAAPSPALRAGLRALLAADPQVDVVGEAATLSAARQVEPHADVIITAGSSVELDDEPPVNRPVPVSGPDYGSPPALLQLVGDQSESLRFTSMVGWRAWGVLPLDCNPEELLAAVKALEQGLLVGDPSLLAPYLSAGRESEPVSSSETLTDREAQVLQLLAQGLANKQIGAALGISEHTVKFHVSAIFSKLGATSRTEAVRLGVRRGIIVL